MPLGDLMELAEESRRLSALCDVHKNDIHLSPEQRGRVAELWPKAAEVTRHGVELWTGPTYHAIIDDVTLVRCAAAVPFYRELLAYKAKVYETGRSIGLSDGEIDGRFTGRVNRADFDGAAAWEAAIDGDAGLGEGEKSRLKDFIFRADETSHHKGLARGDFHDPAVCFAQNVSVEFHKFNSNITAALCGDLAFCGELVRLIPDHWTDADWALGAILYRRHVVPEGVTRLRTAVAALADNATTRVRASWDRRMANFLYADSEGQRGLDGGTNTPQRCQEWLQRCVDDETLVGELAARAVIDNEAGRELCNLLHLPGPKLTVGAAWHGGYNKIFAGCPGTGKSWQVKATVGNGRCVRTVFHPEYTYNDFVGAYRPVCGSDPGALILSASGQNISRPVSYFSFVPGPFMLAVRAALEDRGHPVFLVIEEINRGDCAAIFGDMFQLLDRDHDGTGEYSTELKPEVEQWLTECDAIGSLETDAGGKRVLRIPSNLVLLATMNTSDQSLFPMDSAFKRRWQWEAVALRTDIEVLGGVNLEDPAGAVWPWLSLVSVLNAAIISSGFFEDKRVGPWFLKVGDGVVSVAEFRNKLLFYLWHDVFRNERCRCFREGLNTFEEVQGAFDGSGLRSVLCPAVLSELSKVGTGGATGEAAGGVSSGTGSATGPAAAAGATDAAAIVDGPPGGPDAGS